jgi:hypothetical protein
VEIMGYYKNLEIELQDIYDDDLRAIVAWDHAHRHLLSGEERWRILTNEVLLKRALVLWENGETPKPLPASEHVALQVSRRALRPPKRSRMCVVGWVMIGASIVTSVGILVVNL